MAEGWDDFPAVTDKQDNDPWAEFPASGSGPRTRTQSAEAAPAKNILEKAAEPFTSYWPTYQEKNREAREQIGHGVEQLTGKESSLWERAKGAGNVALGTLGYGTSPIEAGIQTIVGKPIEEATGIPKEYTNFATGLSLPGYGLTRVGRGKIPSTTPNLIPQKTMQKIPTDEAIANRSLADEFGFKLSEGQAERELDKIRFEDMASRGAHGKQAQDVAAPFFEQQFSDIQHGSSGVGERLARNQGAFDNPSLAAGEVASDVGEAARTARGERDVAARAAEQESEAARRFSAQQGDALTDIIRQGHMPIENPREAGEIVGQELRQQSRRDRASFQNAYREAFSHPGEFHAGALEGVGTRIRGDLTLGDNAVIIDDVTTPMASRAVRDVDNISGLRIQNRADPFGAPNPENIVAVDLRGVDQARKRLVSYYQAARSSGNAADARAAGRVIDGFDNQIEQAISNGLFTGDRRALDALRNARAEYSRYARTYRPQGAGDDVGTAMRRIIDRNATPEEIANMVIGSGRVGNAGLPVRLAERLETILGRDSDAWSTMRQAMWERSSNVRMPDGAINPARSAQSITEFSNSSLAQRMFSQQERAAMRAHANGLRNLDNVVASLPEVQAAERSQNAYQRMFGGEGIGGAQAMAFRRMVEGTATHEEVSQAVFNAIGSGNPGNVSRLIDAVRNISGPQSDTMSAIRQGIWQKLTKNAEGKDQPGQQKVAQAINEFLSGKGSSIAREVYSPEERAMMKRYADAIKLTVIPKYARTNSDTAIAAAAGVRNGWSPAVISFTVDKMLSHFPIVGKMAARGINSLLEKHTQATTDKSIADVISKHFHANGGRVGFASGGRSEAKSTQAQAHYRLGGKGKTCGGCQMFRPPHGCTSVAGKVSKVGLCDYFERKAPTFAEGGEVVADETDPFEIAARRTREAARPPGGRYEGALTRAIDTAVEKTLPGMMRTARIPGDAMAGKYAVQPETPGIWTEEDQFRADHAARQRIYDAMALSAYGTGATGTALKNMVPDMLPGVIGKMHQRELMRGHRGARERNPEASGKSSFAEGGDVDEADALIPPPYLNDPTTKTARAIGDAAVDVAAQPFNDIKRGLSGQMTDEEAKKFAFEAAMGFIPMRAGQALSAGSKGAFSSVLKPLDKPMLTNSMNDNTLGIDSLAERIRARIQSMPSAQETFLRPLDQARLAKAQQLSDQKMKEASYVLGPNPTPEEFKRWALRSFEKSKGGDRGDKYSKGGRLPDYMANTMRTRGGR